MGPLTRDDNAFRTQSATLEIAMPDNPTHVAEMDCSAMPDC
jgi:hypothetical protein